MRKVVLVGLILAAGTLNGCADDQPTPEAEVTPTSKVAAGAPSEGPRAVSTTRKRQRVTRTTCARVGHLRSGPLELCQAYNKNDVLSEFRITPGETVLDVELPFPKVYGNVPGHWRWAAVSPDGKTILAQWSGECEVPNAFFIDASGGTPRSVSGPSSRMKSPVSSEALGWTTDGHAIVFIPKLPGCGHSLDSGVFLVDPSEPGPGERIGGSRLRQGPPIQQSRGPRSAPELRRALADAL